MELRKSILRTLISLFIILITQSPVSAQTASNQFVVRPDSRSIEDRFENTLQQSWTEITPPPNGAFRLFSFGSFIFAGNLINGVYRSAINSINWQPASNGLHSNAMIFDFAAMGNSLFAATDKGVYRSTDEGQNWVAVNSGLPLVSGATAAPLPVTVLAVKSNILFAITSNESNSFGSIFRTTDQGRNWVEVKAGLLAPSRPASLASIGSNIFAVVHNDIYRSENNGDSWTAINFSASAIVASGSSLLAVRDTGVWRSSDQGRNWTRTLAVGASLYGGGLGSLTAIGNYVFVAGAYKVSPSSGVIYYSYRSITQGVSWGLDLYSTPIDSNVIQIGSIQASGNNVFVLGRNSLQLPKILALFNLRNLELSTVSAAGFSQTPVAPDSIAAVFGAALATTPQAASSFPLPTTLANTSVIVKDSAGVERSAPLFYVSPNQINFLIPAGAATGDAMVVVINSGAVVGTGTVAIETVAPGLFAANMNGSGAAAAVVLRVKADGSRQYEPVAEFGSAQNKFVARPIDLGSETDRVYLILFGTGIRNRSSLSNVRVSLNGITIETLYAGPQGAFSGLDQINVLIPRSVAGGNVVVSLNVDGRGSNGVEIIVN